LEEEVEKRGLSFVIWSQWEINMSFKQSGIIINDWELPLFQRQAVKLFMLLFKFQRAEGKQK